MKLDTVLSLVVILCLLCTVRSWTQAANDDRVTQLQGYMNFTGKFEMFSGYLTLQQQPLINVHYVFVTSTKKTAKTDDVVLWLNGGPGCSSLLGFAQQVGPNMLKSGSKSFSSYFNPYSWNQQANLLFFESPPGVGFSVNNDPTYIYNESRTADDSVKAVKAWYQKFPEYIQNNFWITGESYCGMYIPNFASSLIDANNQGRIVSGGSITFKGIMIGNGVMVTDRHWRRQARNKFYSKHYFYGPEINKLINNCEYNSSDDRNPSCIRGNNLADQSVDLVNPYATIGICYTPPSQQMHNKHPRRRYHYTPFFEQNNPIVGPGELTAGSSPCTDDVGITAYFNIQKVKEQLNIDPTIEWNACNQNIGQNYHKDASSIEIFTKLKAANLKILLYSGNTDAVVSYVETEKYIELIGWKKIQSKITIKNKRDSLMSWRTEYDGLTFAVVNGAGHMVPSDKPHAAYKMFKQFLNRT